MKKHSINTMKPVSILAILFLVTAVSHANTNSDDNNQDESSSSNLGHNPLIRLPTQTSDLDLAELLNRRRVNLRNRYRVPLTRYIPRRCRQRFAVFPVDRRRGDLATIMKKQAEVIRHRHVAGKFDPIKRDEAVYDQVKEEYDGEWKAGRLHHHHDHGHDHSDDSDDEEYDGEWKAGRHHRRHHDEDHSDDSDDEGHKVHRDEVYAHRFNHHGHKKKGNYIMSKIRKFLSYF